MWHPKILLSVLAVVGLTLAGCGTASDTSQQSASPAPTGTTAGVPDVELTPLIIRQEQGSARPVAGSDGKTHIVYEVSLVNATTLPLEIERIVARSGESVELDLDREESGEVVQLASAAKPTSKVGASEAATAFLTIAFDVGADIPSELTHEVTVSAPGLPSATATSVGAVTDVDDSLPVPALGPPLDAGTGYVVADGCCSAVRHTRAGLPLNNRVWFAQRFAIDWEQLNADGTFSKGDPTKATSYEIYGKKVLAADDGTVVSVLDGLDDQVPGAQPGQSIGLEEADGNNVIINIGDGLYLSYAHLQKGSIKVERGDSVTQGQILGRVGNSGNSLAPHLHFHVMDTPSYLAASGMPYVIEQFDVTGVLESKRSFDEVEVTGEAPETGAAADAGPHTNQLPLDLSIVTFPGPGAESPSE